MTPAAAVDQQVFHFRKAHAVDLQLVVAPLCEVADLPAREAYLAGFAVLRRCQFTDHCLDQQQQLSGLRRHLIQRAPEYFMCQMVGQRDLLPRHLDVLYHLPAMLHAFDLPLVLVQQRDRLDQRQIFHMVAPGARLVAHEGQL